MGTPGLPGPAQRMAAYQAQVQQKTTGPSSIIMPIYTFLIVAFFVFTIVKLVMKKTKRNEPPPFVSDPVFVEKVFKKAQQQQPDNKLGEKQLMLFVLLSCCNLATKHGN